MKKEVNKWYQKTGVIILIIILLIVLSFYFNSSKNYLEERGYEVKSLVNYDSE